MYSIRLIMACPLLFWVLWFPPTSQQVNTSFIGESRVMNGWKFTPYPAVYSSMLIYMFKSKLLLYCKPFCPFPSFPSHLLQLLTSFLVRICLEAVYTFSNTKESYCPNKPQASVPQVKLLRVQWKHTPQPISSFPSPQDSK